MLLSDLITSPWSLAVASFLACAAALPLVLFFSRRSHFNAAPGPLDIHTRPISRLAGVGILLGLLLALAISPIFHFRDHLAFLVALLLVWLTGLADDLRRLPPLLRFLLQTASAILLWWAGWRFPVPALASLLLTWFFVVLFINAFNMLDGADGLAAAVSAVISLGFLLWFVSTADFLGAAVAAALLGACVGFLLFNFPPAKIFMGDSGSYTLGFLIAFLSLEFYRYQPAPGLHWLLPLLLAALPLLDLFFAVLRRLANGLSPFTGDRRHFYDLLLQRGWSPRRVCAISSLGTAVLVLLGWLFGGENVSVLFPLAGMLALCAAVAAFYAASSS